MTQNALNAHSGQSGVVLSGRYRLIRELGRGGFAVVWEALDMRDGTHVAIKALEPGDVQSPSRLEELYARFLVEAEALSRITHPNVVAIRDAATIQRDSGRLFGYYAMELINGRTLDAVVRTQGAIPPVISAELIRQAATGLHAAHQVDVLHRDIKPQNLMLAFDGRVVVMDFGVCKLPGSEGITRIGTVIGTMRYLSPEQMKGEDIESSSDVFSLGLVLFYLVTGTHLRQQTDFASMYVAVCAGSDVQQADNPTVPLPIKRILQRALQPRREERYPTAHALAMDLEVACDELRRHGTTPPQADRAPGNPAELEDTTQSLCMFATSLTELDVGLTPENPGEPTCVSPLLDSLYATCPVCHGVFASVAALARHRDWEHAASKIKQPRPLAASRPSAKPGVGADNRRKIR